jgi:hypothetical protein
MLHLGRGETEDLRINRMTRDTFVAFDAYNSCFGAIQLIFGRIAWRLGFLTSHV